MPPRSTADIRSAYLNFFSQKHGHAVIPSASLIPENDPTTLFTGSGMQPMLPYLLGEKHPLGARITDSQKSFRSQDIEEVGDNRHTTFFEMLGNWSLGDPSAPDGIGRAGYFKREQIPWMFEFLTKEIGLDHSRIYVTVFRGNDEVPRDDVSVKIWKEVFAQTGIDAKDMDFAERDGMQHGRIFYYDERKNWWSRTGQPSMMPVGEPGGPDSEMFWDFGEERGLHENSPWHNQPCHLNCDCGRFLEIGNNVFMEYIRTEKGFEKLTQRNVDFGGGLERIAAACADNPDIFCIDLFDGMRKEIETLSQRKYGTIADETRGFRIVMDHLRAAMFLIADGAPPCNTEQGYFTRRLIRRAIWYGAGAGLPEVFCREIVGALMPKYADAYPELLRKKDEIFEELDMEEHQFYQTLRQGERELNSYLEKHTHIDGAKMFYFYETYGLPRELTEEIMKKKGIEVVDPAGFEKSKSQHQILSRSASGGKFKGGLADHSSETTKLHTATHLLNAALRKVLGNHVYQKGSNITAERLRFDFSHQEKMMKEQLAEVERIVNDAIARDLPVTYHVTTAEKAKEEGAIGVFGERYGAEVKVYQIGPGPSAGSGRDEWSTRPFSLEICGGPHVARTGMLGSFKILKEESSSAGVRRIKAIVSGGPEKVSNAMLLSS